jgi:hypothetical protein
MSRSLAGPARVLEYLSRYTHRVALSNGRLRSIAGGQVTFAYRDRRDHNRPKELTMTAAEFIRRFLLHVTPPGLCRLRHYGFLSNRLKEQQLPRCRTLLDQAEAAAVAVPAPAPALFQGQTGPDTLRCPQCGQGHLVRVKHLPKVPWPQGEEQAPPTGNSS